MTTRRRRIKEWTCSQHYWPQQCECCQNWECDECERSEWKQLGWEEYESEGFHEFLMVMMEKSGPAMFGSDHPLLSMLTKPKDEAE